MATKKVPRKALRKQTAGRAETTAQGRVSKNGLRTLRRRAVKGPTPKGQAPRVRATGRANPGARGTGMLRTVNERLRSIAGARGPLRFTRRVVTRGGVGGRQG
jgi:hypothetical protein